MPRVLITGTAGFIGMHTSIRFLKEGWDVIGFDNLNDYYSVSLKKDRLNEISKVASELEVTFQMFKADLNSVVWKELETIDFDAIIHLAAQAGVRYSIENPRAYLESNILGFQSVIEYVSKMKINRFLYASSSSVYGKNSSQPFSEKAACDSPESYYASTKRANELMAKSYFRTEGLSSIGLRFFTVYGPWGRPDMAPMLFAKAGSSDQTIKVFNHGKQERDFTYVDDIVEGIFKLTTMENFPHQSLICNIGNGAPVGLMDFISILEKSMGIEFRKEFTDAQKGDVESTYADTTLLESLVDYKAKIGLEMGIPLFIDWYRLYFKN
ncbi:NAD-dependent epimerase/dehydratase family protein [Schleiferiaceae bacterium]|nr:NAD-dependent epimerase/dehydratase family protein [Schleiferiaceae bacterium]